jgi:uncharacterized protein DUF4328
MSEFPAYQSPPQYPIGYAVAQSPRVLSVVTIAALVGIIVLVPVSSTAEVYSYHLLAAADRTVSDVRLGGLLGPGDVALTLILTAFAAVTFICWLYRVRTNTDAFGVRGLRWSRGWAIGSWFVPFGNLFIPLMVVGEVDRASESQAALVENRPVDGRRLFVLWAVFWTLRTVAGFVTFLGNLALEGGTSAERTGNLGVFAALTFGSGAVDVAAAVFAILLVRRITANQERVLQAAPIPVTYAGF